MPCPYNVLNEYFFIAKEAIVRRTKLVPVAAADVDAAAAA